MKSGLVKWLFSITFLVGIFSFQGVTTSEARPSSASTKTEQLISFVASCKKPIKLSFQSLSNIGDHSLYRQSFQVSLSQFEQLIAVRFHQNLKNIACHKKPKLVIHLNRNFTRGNDESHPLAVEG